MTYYEHKFLTIKNIVKNNGNKNRAAITLGCTKRNINKLVKRFDETNNRCYVHKNTNMVPTNKINECKVKQIVKLKRDKYKQFTIQHFWEKLIQIEHFSPISLSTIKNILKQHRVVCKSSRKTTIKRYEQELKLLHQKIPDQPPDIKQYQDLILIKSNQHCRIAIEPKFGNVVEVDASEFMFNGNAKWHIHVFADRATNKILAAHFDYQETLESYRHAFMKVLNNYGAPMKLVSDHRGVFTVLRNKNDPENGKLTQFGYWCDKLGTELYCTSVSQKKPWVERVHRILQDRLTAEISLLGEITIDKANDLLDGLIEQINTTLKYTEHGFTNVFEKFNTKTLGDINTFLSIRHTRAIGCGSVFKFKNKIYFACDFKTKKVVNFTAHTKLLILLTYDKRMLLTIGSQFYFALEYEKFTKHQPPKHLSYPPSDMHPWHRLNDFLYFKENNRVEVNDVYEKIVGCRSGNYV